MQMDFHPRRGQNSNMKFEMFRMYIVLFIV